LPRRIARLTREGVRRTAVVAVVRLRPIAEERTEVGERLTERRHVPVEDRLHAIGIRRIELAVVELQIVVHETRLAGCRHGPFESAVELVEERDVDVLRPVPAPLPTRHLTLDEPLRLAEVRQAGRLEVDVVEIRHRIDQGERDAPLDVRVVPHLVRHPGANDDARSPLHDEEARPDHALVFAEQVGPRRGRQVLPQLREHLVLPNHVMRPRRNRAERRTPQDQLPVTETDQVREVRMSTGKLADRELSFELRQPLSNPALRAIPIERLAFAHRRDFGNFGR
jgi:hypothetical protein